MKKVFVAGLLGLVLLGGCRSRTEFGDCIGAFEDRNPALQYKWSTRNIVVGAIFFQTIFAPVLVVLTQAQCPVAGK